MKKLIMLFALFVPFARAQVNLNTTIPAPQVKGILQPQNGGFGIATNTTTGCPRVDAGVWSISPANCAVAAPFSITSFTGCNGTVELGFSVVNPACSATYSALPTSAAITNTDGVSSPTNLSTPFAAATIAGTFSHTAVATTTFTLTAVGSSTQTATQNYQWKPRIFAGLGASGATTTITASGTSAILSTGDALATAGLGSEVVNQTFGPFNPSSQKIYLLLTGSSHTFTDAITGFPLPFDAPSTITFVNQYGVNVTMYLYSSTNVLSGPFQPKVAS